MRGSRRHAGRLNRRGVPPSMLPALKMHSRRLRLITTEKCWYFSSDSCRPFHGNVSTSLVLRDDGQRHVDADETRVVARAPDVVGRHALDDHSGAAMRRRRAASAATTAAAADRDAGWPAGLPGGFGRRTRSRRSATTDAGTA